MKTITSNTKPTTTKAAYEPLSNDGYNYLWQLTNLGAIIPAFKGMLIFKDGFARSVYAGNKDGVESRIKNTLADMEKKLNIEIEKMFSQNTQTPLNPLRLLLFQSL